MTPAMTPTVAWLDEMSPASATTIAGGKMGRLAELREAGVTVPSGFAVTTSAYREHCARTGLEAIIDETLPRTSTADGLAEAATDIRAAVERTPLSDELAAAITDAYEDLCLRCLDINTPVAVRSSATGEDSAAASFAGIFETYLGVSGSARVLDAIRRCWSSLFTPRALAYRRHHDISHRDMPIAVGVLELVQPRASGIAFSREPVTGKDNRVVVEGSWGWGEAVVQGMVTPDHVEVDKADQRVLRYDTARKTVVSTFDYSCGEVTEADMPARLQERPALGDEHVSAITTAVAAIEAHYGYPVDVEWVIRRDHRPGDPAIIVQTRPVTGSDDGETRRQPPTWDPVAYAATYAFGRGKGSGR